MSFDINQCSESIEFVAQEGYGYVYVHISLLDFVDQYITDGTEDTNFNGQFENFGSSEKHFILNLMVVYDDNWKDRFSSNSIER